MILDRNKVSDALVDRPGGAITGVAQKAYFTQPNPVTFSIEWITKDLTYAKKMVKHLNVGLLDEVLFEYKKAMKKGFMKKDWTSINRQV